MLVSVVVPVYGVEKYIERCFKSVEEQTYPYLECLFIDDCSLDNSRNILESLIDQYEGVIDFKIVSHQKNKGLSGARNTGLLASNGEYVYFLDSDDDIPKDSISNLVQTLDKVNGFVEMVQGSTMIFQGEKIFNRYVLSSRLPSVIHGNAQIRTNILERKTPVTAWNRLISRKFLLENNLYFKEGIIHEDEYWGFQLARKIDSIAYCFDVTYNHYINPNSITTSGYKKSLDNWLFILSLISDEINENSREEKIFYLKSGYSGVFLKSLKFVNKEEAKLYIGKLYEVCLGNEWVSSDLFAKMYCSLYNLPYFVQNFIVKVVPVRVLFTRFLLSMVAK
ncbi:glycosyltransferase family 2 protein [Persicobacter psychrovividus]